MAQITNKWITDGTITEAKLDINNAPTDQYYLQWQDGAGKPVWVSVSADAHDVYVSANDTTGGFLNGKLVIVSGKTTLTENNDGANETLSIGIGADIFDHTSDDTDVITEGSSNLFYTDARVKTKVQAAEAYTIGGTWTFSNVVIGATPTLDTHFATKGYVDGVASGLDLKDSVTVATTAALPANTAAGSKVGKTLTADAVGVLTVDGVATVLGDRILVKDEGNADNGIYEVTTEGTAGVAFVLTRATDADEDDEVTAGMFCFVSEGTANGNEGWVCTTDDPITVDTTTQLFSQFSDAAAYTGGVGITINSGAIDYDPNTLTAAAVSVSADSIMIIDADDSLPKKESIVDLASAMAGTGLSASSGQLTLTDTTTIEQKIVEIVTLDATDISNKYNDDLTQVPLTATAVQVTPVGGPEQEYTVDFTIITDGADIKRINWNGLGLDGVLAVADKLIVSYTY